MDKPKILVVDDEQEMANFIADAINENGKHEALIAHSAKEAFDQLKENRRLLGLAGNKIQLILLDIKMPEMDGLQFLEELRKRHNDEKFGVIMITAYEDEEKWDRATSGFVSGYIKKPVTKANLISVLDRFFSNPEARYKMTVETFEKHIDKREELEKGRGK
ncbi:response regulator [Patescibacteria group bacterium]|nr:response regulator [Patescibacteria group bacterium]